MASGTSEETAPTGDGGKPASETVVEKDKEEAEEGTEEVEEMKEKNKQGRKKGGGKEEKEVKTPEKVRRRRSWVESATPVERPSRERKTVDRFMSMSPRKSTSPKTVIKQGSGTKLRDIPNVFFKLSKRKVDENLQHLHRILFGKRATVHYVKRNIFEFSGFVWSDNEGKDKAKLREKLDKCVKDRLLDFCDMLDIPVSRTGTKKEDVVVLMLDFLQCPRVTRDVVLKAKEPSGGKRKRKAKGSKISTPRQMKRKKKNSGKTNDKDQDKNERVKDPTDEGGSGSEDISEHSDQDKNEAEEDPKIGAEPVKDSPGEKKIEKESRSLASDEKESLKKRKTESKKDTSKKKGGGRTTASEKFSPDKGVSAKDDKEPVAPSGTKIKNSTSRRQKNQDSSTEKKANKKQTPEIKDKPKASGKDDGQKGKAVEKDVESPTRHEVHAVVSDILKEVDFDTATLADILRQLGIHFGADLMHRKAEVKSIVEEVINSMTDFSEEEVGAAVDASGKGGDAEALVRNDDSKEKRVRSDDVKESPKEGKDE